MRLSVGSLLQIICATILCNSVSADTPSEDPIIFAVKERFPKHIPLDGPAVVFPAVSAKEASRGEIVLLFRNVSDKPFHFLEGSRPDSPASLQWVLYKDGELVPPLFTLVPPALSPDRVRILNPGEYLIDRFSLGDRFGVDRKQGNLPAGTYELRAEYSVQEGTDRHEIGCTPLVINRTVMLIQITDGGRVSSAGWLGILVAVISCLIGLLLFQRCRHCRASANDRGDLGSAGTGTNREPGTEGGNSGQADASLAAILGSQAFGMERRP